MVTAGPAPAIFVDTSAWYALFVSTEPRHAEAAAIYGRLRASLASLVCTDWVLLETAALLDRRVSRADAQRVVGVLLNTPLVKVLWMDRETAELALERYRSVRPTVSLVDAASFAVMDREGIRRAFAFDGDFQAQGYAVER